MMPQNVMQEETTAIAGQNQPKKDRFLRWLAVELAPTLCGSKPSTILSLINTKSQQALSLWREYGKAVFCDAGVRTLSLRSFADRECVLFYRPDTLLWCINRPAYRAFLENLGYPVEQGSEACLAVLKARFHQCCPHEIGVFLGIPLKDVLGFMGMISLRETCRRDWCIYGNPEESIAVIERFAQDRTHVERLLAIGFCPVEIICRGKERLSYTA
ncbi:DUF3793 family protein [Propionispora vibrioides]|uniref:DUF3793 family protein n=1 Tax=Propionispora vibrioides TaxID=112903 RepID=A0A1H8X6M7_9FIRM|nr:DUF3793 family protein [Propionispora vibrioides]SEP35363.1 Protein of unknown function [Propionispora vibrioides]